MVRVRDSRASIWSGARLRDADRHQGDPAAAATTSLARAASAYRRRTMRAASQMSRPLGPLAAEQERHIFHLERKPRAGHSCAGERSERRSSSSSPSGVSAARPRTLALLAVKQLIRPLTCRNGEVGQGMRPRRVLPWGAVRPLSTVCASSPSRSRSFCSATWRRRRATDAFQQDVVGTNTADEAFAYIRRPESSKDLIARLRTNRDRLATASGTIAAAEPEDLAERQRLAGALSAMSKEMEAAANSIELVQSGPAEAGQVESLIFETWDAVNAALSDLREGGIAVPPLRPGGGAWDFAAGSGAAPFVAAPGWRAPPLARRSGALQWP